MSLVVVTGVGTGIGKTHLAVALVRAWGRHEAVLGYKPVESGVTGSVGEDEGALSAVSTFHVKHSLPQTRLREPVSPHLAARAEGRELDLREIVMAVDALRREVSIVLELAGGLFTPLSETTSNADLALALAPDLTLLAAPNRLGVLHDVLAVREACRHRHLPIAGIVLSASAAPDASSATNPTELPLVSGLPLLANLPRASVEDLVASGALDALVARCRATT
jgi:dethiobiotin synthetase